MAAGPGGSSGYGEGALCKCLPSSHSVLPLLVAMGQDVVGWCSQLLSAL